MIPQNGAAKIHMDSFETNSGEEITYSVYSSFQEIADLQVEWDSFVEAVGGDIYLTYDWCRIWWEFYGEKRHLRIYLFYKDNRLVGVIPIFYAMQWIGPVWLKLAKMVGSDSTICMVNPPVHADFAATIFRYVIDSLIRKEGCDAVWFGPIGGKYDSLQDLRDTIQGYSEVTLFQERVQSPYTTFLLPKTFEDYIQSLDKRQRGNLRRDLNLINKSFQITQDVIQDESIASYEFENFVQMHTAQWKAEGKLGHFHDWPLGVEFNAKILIEQAKQGRLRLIRLLADGRVVSYQLCYAFGNCWYWRLPARPVGTDWDKYALGRIGLIKEIEMAIAEGVQEIEAGAGHYEYKVKLGGEEHPLYSILLVRKQLFCRWRAFLFARFSELLNFCYYRVWFQRLAPKLPFRRRPLWKLWIRTRL
jgi:Acetyltransferase (GNAT) domain